MQKTRSDPDDEGDTAFGGLAPRSGPGGEGRRARRLAIGLAVAAVIVLIGFVALYLGGHA